MKCLPFIIILCPVVCHMHTCVCIHVYINEILIKCTINFRNKNMHIHASACTWICFILLYIWKQKWASETRCLYVPDVVWWTSKRRFRYCVCMHVQHVQKIYFASFFANYQFGNSRCLSDTSTTIIRKICGLYSLQAMAISSTKDELITSRSMHISLTNISAKKRAHACVCV